MDGLTNQDLLKYVIKKNYGAKYENILEDGAGYGTGTGEGNGDGTGDGAGDGAGYGEENGTGYGTI